MSFVPSAPARVNLLLRHYLLHLRPRHHVVPALQARCASASAASAGSSKPKVLKKPLRYVPPSHPAIYRKRDMPRHYGGELSAEQRAAQLARRYPNMFPLKGTKMHWFLTNRWIHGVLCMGILFTLAAYTWYHDWTQRSPASFAALPSLRDLAHPPTFVAKVHEALRLNMEHNTLVSQERRRRHAEDAQKRRAYRLVHGLDGPDSSGVQVGEFGPAVGAVDPVHGGPKESREAWKAWWNGERAEKEGRLAQRELARREGREVREETLGAEGAEGFSVVAGGVQEQAAQAGLQEEAPPRRRKPKKWLGIWE